MRVRRIPARGWMDEDGWVVQGKDYVDFHSSRTITDRLGELETQMDSLRQEAGQIDDQLRGLSESAGRVATAIDLLDSFDDLWDALIPDLTTLAWIQCVASLAGAVYGGMQSS